MNASKVPDVLKNVVKNAVPALAAKLENLHEASGLTNTQKATKAAEFATKLLQTELKNKKEELTTFKKGGNGTKKNQKKRKEPPKGKVLAALTVLAAGVAGAGFQALKNYGQSLYMQEEFVGSEDAYNQVAYNMLWGALFAIAGQTAHETGLTQAAYRLANKGINKTFVRRFTDYRFANPNTNTNTNTNTNATKKNKNQNNEPGSPVNDPKPPNNIRINMPHTPLEE